MGPSSVPQLGQEAPDFRLPSTEGEVHLAERSAAGKVLLAFYTEDGTPACSAGLIGFREEHDLIRELGASVIAVSRDGLVRHREFAEQAGGFPFPLASDEDLAVGARYGVVEPGTKRHARAVFVLGRGGKVLHLDTHFQPGSVPAMTAIFESLGLEF